MNIYGDWSDDNGMGPTALQIVDYNGKVNPTSWLVDLEYRDRQFTKDWDLGIRLHAVYLKSDNYSQLLPAAFVNMIGNPMTTSKYGGAEVTAFYKGLHRHEFRLSAGV